MKTYSQTTIRLLHAILLCVVIMFTLNPRNNPKTWIDTLCSWPEGPSCQLIIHMMAIQRDYNLAQFSSTPF